MDWRIHDYEVLVFSPFCSKKKEKNPTPTDPVSSHINTYWGYPEKFIDLLESDQGRSIFRFNISRGSYLIYKVRSFRLLEGGKFPDGIIGGIDPNWRLNKETEKKSRQLTGKTKNPFWLALVWMKEKKKENNNFFLFLVFLISLAISISIQNNRDPEKEKTTLIYGLKQNKESVLLQNLTGFNWDSIIDSDTATQPSVVLDRDTNSIIGNPRNKENKEKKSQEKRDEPGDCSGWF